MIASQVHVDSYLRGREICAKNPAQRKSIELKVLEQWLLERSKVFKNTSTDGLSKVCKHASLKVIKPDQLIYQQEDVVESFYVILRGSVSLMSDPQFRAKQLAATQTTLSNQILATSNTKRKSIVGAAPKSTGELKFVSKPNLGIEVEQLSSSGFFGHEALVQKDDTTPFSAVANEYTELLIVDAWLFEDTFLPYFETDLYNKALYLAKLDIFSHWSPSLLRQLAISAKEMKFQSGECLFQQGMSFSHVYILQSGSVKISSGSFSKPPQQLLDQIRPPVDYLSGILSERPCSTIPFRNRNSTTGASPSSVSTSLFSRPRVSIGRSASAPPLKRRQRKVPKKESESPNQIMGFRLQEPRPRSTSQLCCLGPANMLNHIEALCKVKRTLFNAVALSETAVIAIETFAFVQLLEKKPCHTLHSLTKQILERVQSWQSRNPSVLFFRPLQEVLRQLIKDLETGRGGRLFRESGKASTKSVHSPEKRAYVAAKTLGKNLTDTLVDSLQNGLPTKPLVTQVSTQKQFLVRQLTQCKVANPSFFLCIRRKEVTSFDSPLPRKQLPISMPVWSQPSESSQSDVEHPEILQPISDASESSCPTAAASVKEAYIDTSPVLSTHVKSNTLGSSDSDSGCGEPKRLLNIEIHLPSDEEQIHPRPQLEDYTKHNTCDSMIEENGSDVPFHDLSSDTTQVMSSRNASAKTKYRLSFPPSNHAQSVNSAVKDNVLTRTHLFLRSSERMTNKSHKEVPDLSSLIRSPQPPVNLTPTTRPYYM